jgi:hypothetical protein
MAFLEEGRVWIAPEFDSAKLKEQELYKQACKKYPQRVKLEIMSDIGKSHRDESTQTSASVQ